MNVSLISYCYFQIFESHFISKDLLSIFMLRFFCAFLWQDVNIHLLFYVLTLFLLLGQLSYIICLPYPDFCKPDYKCEKFNWKNRPFNVLILCCFYYYVFQKDEVYLNLVLEYIPETVYKVARHYSKSKQTIPISFIKVSDYNILFLQFKCNCVQ